MKYFLIIFHSMLQKNIENNELFAKSVCFCKTTLENLMFQPKMSLIEYLLQGVSKVVEKY